MARMVPYERKRFPTLARWIDVELPRCFDEPVVLKAFTDCTELDEASARQAVLPGNDPWVHVRPIPPDDLGRPRYGRFDEEFQTRVVVDVGVAGRFETNGGGDAARFFLKATVLHEMAHWADYKTNGRRLDIAEVGNAFELAAFGRVVDEPPWSEAPDATFVFPVHGRISSGTGYWGKNIRRRENGELRSHQGIDVFADLGEPVYAAADGRVIDGNRYRRGETFLAQKDTYGQMIDIDHGNGLVTRYAHLATVEVESGARVRRGSVIGTVGASGTLYGVWLHAGKPSDGPGAQATRPHLHFEVLKAAGNPFRTIDSTHDPATFFEWIPPGRGARGAEVQALRQGKSLLAMGYAAPTLEG